MRWTLLACHVLPSSPWIPAPWMSHHVCLRVHDRACAWLPLLQPQGFHLRMRNVHHTVILLHLLSLINVTENEAGWLQQLQSVVLKCVSVTTHTLVYSREYKLRTVQFKPTALCTHKYFFTYLSVCCKDTFHICGLRHALLLSDSDSITSQRQHCVQFKQLPLASSVLVNLIAFSWEIRWRPVSSLPLLRGPQRHSFQDEIKMASVNPAFQLQAVIQRASLGDWLRLQQGEIQQAGQIQADTV